MLHRATSRLPSPQGGAPEISRASADAASGLCPPSTHAPAFFRSGSGHHRPGHREAGSAFLAAAAKAAGPIPSPDARSHEAASATAALSRWNPPIIPTRSRSRSRPGRDTAIVPSRRSLQSKVRPSSQAPHPSRRARRRTTARAAGRSRPVTSGTPLRRIPAFSAAILPSVFPSHSRWSYPTVVMTDTAGRHALVASHRPPSPVSMTAIRTPFRRNQSEADQVIFSNQVSGSPAGERRSATRKPSRSARGEIIFPSMRTRSSGATRCGEVYRPMGPSGNRRRTSYAKEAVDPLPLVPATWRVRNAFSGCPDRENADTIRDSPGRTFSGPEGPVPPIIDPRNPTGTAGSSKASP